MSALPATRFELETAIEITYFSSRLRDRDDFSEGNFNGNDVESIYWIKNE